MQGVPASQHALLVTKNLFNYSNMGDRYDEDKERRQDPRDHDEERRPWRDYYSEDRHSQQQQRRSSPSRRDDSRDQHNESRPRYNGSHSAAVNFEQRRQQRMDNTFSIWPASPPPPKRRSPSPQQDSDDSDVKRKSKASRKRDDSDASDDERKSKKKKSKKHKHKKSSKKRSRADSAGSEEDVEDKKKKKQNKKRRRSEEDDKDSDDDDSDQEDVPFKSESGSADETVKDYWAVKKVQQDDDIMVGPAPLPSMDDGSLNPSYGGQLMPGEGSAMAAYIAAGKRIPRRGEIGLNSGEIENYEKAGFVMSGSRHRRMNAVRVRKENQVISAEEKRALMSFNQEEKAKREAKIIADFKEMVSDKIRKVQGPGANPDM
ncbi:hypothetical protein SmJEL517_g02325 [Synchytrium microbalum]|uniref:NF-kappa-B-activating protein C-terminal domain-containing protein n=1 Tax=Synchytrium microbalum TaxID=1806994 RepID=A0A507CCF3_9FUNG|nr:uncharacterized protein SmJEL517_g02325 [Synchytrium microbalum]TPX35223.1 hypothetical protein SmJEL517_g02325 [Synchytrium microbalum]